MYTNSSATLYRYQNGSYKRTYFPSVFWDECKQSNIIKSGNVNSDSVTVFLPYLSSLSFSTGKDLIIKGKCECEIDSSTQQKLSESLKYLKDNYIMLTVMVADLKDYGSKDMWHYELSCK
jgi:hypothetical protein